MTIYTGPLKETSFYVAKFIRIEEEIFTTKPNDINTSHILLAERDGILERFKQMTQENPDEVDEGVYNVARPFIGILDNVRKGTLGIVRTENARNKTRDVFRKLSEGYEIDLYP